MVRSVGFLICILSFNMLSCQRFSCLYFHADIDSIEHRESTAFLHQSPASRMDRSAYLRNESMNNSKDFGSGGHVKIEGSGRHKAIETLMAANDALRKSMMPNELGNRDHMIHKGLGTKTAVHHPWPEHQYYRLVPSLNQRNHSLENVFSNGQVMHGKEHSKR